MNEKLHLTTSDTPQQADESMKAEQDLDWKTSVGGQTPAAAWGVSLLFAYWLPNPISWQISSL